MVPRNLIDDFRRTPAAIAIYALIVRLWFVSNEEVPLSASDLLRYDPSLSYGAARRSLDQLVTDGWLVRTGSGIKKAFLPTWGIIAGAPRLLSRTAPQLNRPHHVKTIRVDLRLLDVCVGILRPHRSHHAVVTRYMSMPLLSLADVGAYAVALAGIPVVNQTLTQIGLLRDGNVYTLPDVQTILAWASWGARGVTLTPTGYHRLGIPLQDPLPSGEPLFFVPSGVDAELITEVTIDPVADLITLDAPGESTFAALACDIEPVVGVDVTAHEKKERKNQKETPPHHQTPTPPKRSGGGGGYRPHSGETSEPDDRTTAPAPQPETVALLREVGVHPTEIKRLATLAPGQVTQAIAYARSMPQCRSIPGMVVHLLRAVRDDNYPIPEPLAPSRQKPGEAEFDDDELERLWTSHGTPSRGHTPTTPVEQDSIPAPVCAPDVSTAACPDQHLIVSNTQPPSEPLSSDTGSTVEPEIAPPASEKPTLRRQSGRVRSLVAFCHSQMVRRPSWIHPLRWRQLSVAVRHVLRSTQKGADGTINHVSEAALRVIVRRYPALQADIRASTTYRNVRHGYRPHANSY